MLAFRDATDADYQAICDFLACREELLYVFPGANYPFTVTELKTIFEKRCNQTVAVHDHQIAGFADLYQIERGKESYLGNLIIRPSKRKLSVGTGLANHMIELAKNEYNIRIVKLNCWAENTAALLFYTRVGFFPEMIFKKEIHGKTVAIIEMHKHV